MAHVRGAAHARASTSSSSPAVERCRTSRAVAGIAHRRRRDRRSRARRSLVVDDDVLDKAHDDDDVRAWGPTARDARRVRDELYEKSLTNAGWDDTRAFLAARASTALGRAACEELEALETTAAAERALNETAAAMAMESTHGVSLEFGGMLTAEVRRGFFKTRQGSPLGGDELAATAAFLDSAKRLKLSIEGVTESGELPKALAPLRNIAYEMTTHSDLADMIRNAVDETGEFRDNASQELRRARSQKGAAEGKLKKALQGKGTPTTHQGRMVLAVPAPAPPDVLVVGTMAGGALILIEPPGIVALNSELAKAIDAEKSAIDGIKRELSNAIAAVVEELFKVLDIVVRLDVIAAKCRYSQALNGVRPVFSNSSGDEEIVEYKSTDEDDFDDEEEDDDRFVDRSQDDRISPSLALELVGLRQPVLASQAIQAALERRKAAAEEATAGKGVGTQGGYKTATLGQIQKLKKKELEKDLGFDFDDDFDDFEDDDSDDGSKPKLKGPVPVDVFASKKTRVVVITGPNTGGKTAAMKAVGLAALMAKSGLFIPAEKAVLPFFDKVLIDIGDDQSLLTSLSTFSGRLTRAQAILEQCTRDSLVLMDEVGTGTSPGEGAAIGYALLKALAGLVPNQCGAGLTLATTHHGQLKALKYEYPEFENAAVEFDEADLRPTYKLLWGVPGRSSALQIATRYNLDSDVVADARDMLGEGLVSLDDTISKLETARRDADADIASALTALNEIEYIIPKVQSAMDTVSQARDAAAYARASGVMEAMRDNRARLAEAARKEAQLKSPALSKISAAASGETDKTRNERLKREEEERLKAEQELLDGSWRPSEGEAVTIQSTGMNGTVVSVDDTQVTVQAGTLFQIKVNVRDLKPSNGGVNRAPVKLKTKSVRGASQAARRADDLLATSARTPNAPKPTTSAKAMNFALSEDDMNATVGDIVVVKKTGFKGKVIDDEDGLLTVQAGAQRVLAPAHTVEITGVGKSAADKTVSKKKKGKIKGFNLPQATNDASASSTSSAKPNATTSLDALQAKFGKKK